MIVNANLSSRGFLECFILLVFLWLEGGVVLRGQEVGTGLDDVGEFAMTDDTGIGIFFPQVFQE